MHNKAKTTGCCKMAKNVWHNAQGVETMSRQAVKWILSMGVEIVLMKWMIV